MDDSLNISLRRRARWEIGASPFFVSAYRAKPMRLFLNISLCSYLDRPIFDVKMNGTDFMDAAGNSFYGSNPVIMMQPITLGPQTVTWKLDGPEGAPRDGELVTAKVKPKLS